jgi:leucyl/phenylalanyl-tRNA--protein transferase
MRRGRAHHHPMHWLTPFGHLLSALRRRGPVLDPRRADAYGLVAMGGDLRPERLIEAYRNGIFPWFPEGSPVLWWSPDPRAIFELDGLRVSRRLARTVRSGRFSVTVNRDFDGVIRGCADRTEGTWITAGMIEGYTALHRRGAAHSIEVWHEGRLAGGLYGVALGGLFAGESMFTRVRDASKVALVHLAERLRTRGFQLFDIQYRTPHTAGLGAAEIPRAEYLSRLRRALECPAVFACGWSGFNPSSAAEAPAARGAVRAEAPEVPAPAVGIPAAAGRSVVRPAGGSPARGPAGT